MHKPLMFYSLERNNKEHLSITIFIRGSFHIICIKMYKKTPVVMTTGFMYHTTNLMGWLGICLSKPTALPVEVAIHCVNNIHISLVPGGLK